MTERYRNSPRKFHNKLAWLIRQPWFALLVIMAVGAVSIGFTKHQLQHYSNQNRLELSAHTRSVLIENCQRGNDLRGVLRVILKQEYPGIKAAVKSGRVSPQEAAAARVLIRGDIARVANTNCTKQYSTIH